MFIESNLNRFRGGLNVFHLMTLIGWESAFKFEGLCLFFETITNNLVVGIRSFIERLWRFTHDFSTIYSKKSVIATEFKEKAYSENWITSLEELYSVVDIIDLNYNFEKFIENFPSINLNFDYNNGEILLLLNKLRNTYIHLSPWSVLGVKKSRFLILATPLILCFLL